MEDIRNFIDLVALGDNIAAKEELDKNLSQKSFDVLDSRKQQIAGAIFGTTEEPELDLDNAVAELEDVETDVVNAASSASPTTVIFGVIVNPLVISIAIYCLC